MYIIGFNFTNKNKKEISRNDFIYVVVVIIIIINIELFIEQCFVVPWLQQVYLSLFALIDQEFYE